MGDNARGKDRPNDFICYGKGFVFVAHEQQIYTRSGKSVRIGCKT